MIILITGLAVTLLGLFLHAKYNAIMDHIMFFRTHGAGHPYRDYWHLSKHISRGGLLLLSFGLGLQIQSIGWYFLLNVLFIPLFYIIWRRYAFAKPSNKYYLTDESMKLSIGIKLLDKALGFHH